jgi:hypothetical protein
MPLLNHFSSQQQHPLGIFLPSSNSKPHLPPSLPPSFLKIEPQDSRFPNQDALCHNRQTNKKLLQLSAAVPPTPHGFHKNPASCYGQARRGCGHRMSLLTTEYNAPQAKLLPLQSPTACHLRHYIFHSLVSCKLNFTLSTLLVEARKATHTRLQQLRKGGSCEMSSQEHRNKWLWPKSMSPS